MIYFIRAEGINLVKIGYTSSESIDGRLGSLRTMSPVALKCVGLMPGDIQDEQTIHHRFANVRSHGEWFWLSHELIDYIRERTGKPSRRSNSRRRPQRQMTKITVPCPPGFKQWAYDLMNDNRINLAVMIDAGLRLLAESRGQAGPPVLVERFRRPLAICKMFHPNTEKYLEVQTDMDWRFWASEFAAMLGVDLGNLMRDALIAYGQSIGFEMPETLAINSGRDHQVC